MYTDDYNGSFSVGDDPAINWDRGEWMNALKTYYGKKPYLLICPVAKVRRAPNPATETLMPVDSPESAVADYGGPRTAFQFPSTDPEVLPNAVNNRIIASYGANCWIYNTPATLTAHQSRPTVYNWRKIHAATRPSDTPLMADSMWRGGGPHTGRAQAIQAPDFNGQWIGAGHEMMHFAMHRHAKSIQMTFFDGSARSQRARHLWKLYWHKDFDIGYGDKNPTTCYKPWMN
jgi:hypothetical protein